MTLNSAGQGQEDYQIIGDKVLSYSDREVMCERLNQEGL